MSTEIEKSIIKIFVELILYTLYTEIKKQTSFNLEDLFVYLKKAMTKIVL